jgi:hypothetical protein
MPEYESRREQTDLIGWTNKAVMADEAGQGWGHEAARSYVKREREAKGSFQEETYCINSIEHRPSESFFSGGETEIWI